MAHLAMSMPNGATNMAMMPSIMRRAKRGMRSNRRSIDSMSREPMWCSAVPTQRNRSDLAAAWKMVSRIAAQIASPVPTPAQATIKPRLAMVEYARTRLALVCEIAMNEHSMKVMPPTRMTMVAGARHTEKSGASLISRKTPALTMVDEWSSALVGVGATIAPKSHVWKGICAALVRPAKARKPTGTATRLGFSLPISMKWAKSSVPMLMAHQ